MSIRIHARINILKKNTNEVKLSNDFVVKFYDKNAQVDRSLGEVILDESGEVSLEFEPMIFKANDLVFDNYPDVYFKVFNRNIEIFKSKIYSNIHWKISTNEKGKSVFIYELGTILVEPFSA